MNIWSTGGWGALIATNNVKKEDFCCNLIILKKFIEWWLQLDWNNADIWLDNATVHSVNMTKTVAYLLGLRLKFLPPYSPNLAPVEIVFGVMKRYLVTQSSIGLIHFNRKTGIETIQRSMAKLIPTFVVKLWIRFIKEGRRFTLNALWIWRERQYLEENHNAFIIE